MVLKHNLINKDFVINKIVKSVQINSRQNELTIVYQNDTSVRLVAVTDNYIHQINQTTDDTKFVMTNELDKIQNQKIIDLELYEIYFEMQNNINITYYNIYFHLDNNKIILITMENHSTGFGLGSGWIEIISER